MVKIPDVRYCCDCAAVVAQRVMRRCVRCTDELRNWNAIYNPRKTQALIPVMPHSVRLQKRIRERIIGAKNRSAGKENWFTLSDAQCDLFARQTHCARTNLPFMLDIFSRGNKAPYAPSIDRIDSARGYHADNVQFVCTMYNIGKQDAHERDFIIMCMAVAEKHSDDPYLRSRLREMRAA